MNFYQIDSTFSNVCWQDKTNVGKMGNMNVEIFYVVSVHMSGEIILKDWKVWRYGPDRNQGHFFLFIRKKPIKEISVKVTSIVMDSQSIDDVVFSACIKRWFAA